MSNTTTSAILDITRSFIVVVGEHDDRVTDPAAIAEAIGGWPGPTHDLSRVVWLPMGGEVGDTVDVDGDGVAYVTAEMTR